MSVVAIVGDRKRSCLKDHLDFTTLTTKDARQIMEDLMVRMMQEDTHIGQLMRKHMLKDYQLVDRILGKLLSKYGGNLSVISIGCDDGIGAIVKAICIGKGVRFVELTCHFWDNMYRRSRAEYMQFYQARNAFLDELGDEFHLLVNDSRHSMVENLLERINATSPTRPKKRPRTLYAENGSILPEE